jgi:hypothetical protein
MVYKKIVVTLMLQYPFRLQKTAPWFQGHSGKRAARSCARLLESKYFIYFAQCAHTKLKAAFKKIPAEMVMYEHGSG